MQAVKRNNLDFQKRLKLGHNFEDKVKKYLFGLGVIAYPFGLEYLSNSAKKALIGLNDPTSLLIRFSPDLFCLVPGKFAFFVECKSSQSNTSNYSYNLESYQTSLKLSRMGIKILCVFSDLKAQWIENLPIRRQIMSVDKLKYVNGSQKPYILIPKDKLLNLTKIIRDINN